MMLILRDADVEGSTISASRKLSVASLSSSHQSTSPAGEEELVVDTGNPHAREIVNHTIDSNVVCNLQFLSTTQKGYWKFGMQEFQIKFAEISHETV